VALTTGASVWRESNKPLALAAALVVVIVIIVVGKRQMGRAHGQRAGEQECQDGFEWKWVHVSILRLIGS
jgi:hypothetical protein